MKKKTWDERLHEAELCNHHGPMQQVLGEKPWAKIKKLVAQNGTNHIKKNFATNATTPRGFDRI